MKFFVIGKRKNNILKVEEFIFYFKNNELKINIISKKNPWFTKGFLI